MSTFNRSMSDVRAQAKQIDSNPNIPHHTNTFRSASSSGGPGTRPSGSTPPINSNFKSKLGLGAGIGGGLLGAGALAKSLSSNNSVGEVGGHFHNAFANLTGMHENEGAAPAGASAGVSVMSSSEAMPASGGGSFHMLKDKSPLTEDNFKQRLKNLKIRRS